MLQEAASTEKTPAIRRLERKIVIAPRYAGYVIAWLKHACRPDPLYPLNAINSLYFDTPDLDAYYQCLNGDIYKDKVRLRWYDRPDTDHDVKAYIEVKSKTGFNTVKQRKQILIPGAALGDDIVPGGRIQQEVAKTLPELGYVLPRPMQPLIVISYRRYRFIDPSSNMGISYDVQIASQMAVGSAAKWAPRLELNATVLEIKSETMTVPEVLRSLRNIQLIWSAFSKYAKCLGSHFEQPGSDDWVQP